MSETTLLENPTASDDLRQEVAQEIIKAFAAAPYPGDNGIVKPGSDGADLVTALQGKTWDDLDIGTIATCHIDMPLLTAEAFRYYLPAFMLALIFQYQHSGTLPMSLMHNLTPPDAASLQTYNENPTETSKSRRVGDFLHRVSSFSPKEKAAIGLFLETYEQWCPKPRGEQRFLPQAVDFWKAR
jgi:hypothetical protein